VDVSGDLIPRLAEQRLDQLMRGFRVVVVNGPRQAGKTTLLQLFAGRHGGDVITLDDRTSLQFAVDDPGTLVAEAARPTMIDEVQRAGDPLVLAIKAVVDRDRSRGQFLLSGSAQFLTVPRLSESLAGRAAFMELWPLAMAERTGVTPDFTDLAFTDPAALRRGRTHWTRTGYIDAITEGGFPEVLELTPADRRTWYDSYLRTVISRDIVEFAQIERGAAVPRLLNLLAARAGGTAVLADLAQDTELARDTVRNYLSYLDGVFLTSSVPVWSANLNHRAAKTPKIYLTDSGLTAHVLLTGPEALARPGNPALGGLVETFVFTELTKLRAASPDPFKVYYYRDRLGHEVDFVLERYDGSVVAIEVKATASPSARDAAGLVWLRDQIGERFVTGIVLHQGEAVGSFGDRIQVLPLSALWRHAPLAAMPAG
jgi:uncharacterized protein